MVGLFIRKFIEWNPKFGLFQLPVPGNPEHDSDRKVNGNMLFSGSVVHLKFRRMTCVQSGQIGFFKPKFEDWFFYIPNGFGLILVFG